jgi:hypothetical protein
MAATSRKNGFLTFIVKNVFCSAIGRQEPTNKEIGRTIRLAPKRISDWMHIDSFSPYRKENTSLHHYKDQLVNVV